MRAEAPEDSLGQARSASQAPSAMHSRGRQGIWGKRAQLGTWFVSVYVIAAIQAWIPLPFGTFSLENAITRGDVVAALMLIYFAVIFDPMTSDYILSRLGPDIHNFLIVLAVATYVAGFAFLVNSRDQGFLNSPWSFWGGAVLALVYFGVAVFAMAKRTLSSASAAEGRG